MAKIKFGMMMTDARGKLGGQVFTKTRSGATIRTKVTPKNAQTAAQQTARAILGNLSTAWRNLDEEQRDSWNSAVDGFKKSNIFGDAYSPSGKNLFVGLNANLATIYVSRQNFAPAPIEVPAVIIDSVSFSAVEGELSFGFLTPYPGALYTVVYQATKPSSPGKYNFSGSYVTFASKAGPTSIAPVVLYNAYVAKFGTAADGLKVAFRVFVVASTTGQKSVESTGSALVVG